MSSKKRDYRAEYDNYQGTKEQRENRSSRNKARRKMVACGAKVVGLDVDHKNGNPKDNRKSNLRVMSKSANRSKK
jgi:hypothetical protein